MGRNLFKRCVTCPESPPSCPSCAPGEKCSLILKTCDQCARTQCIGGGSASATQSNTPATTSSTAKSSTSAAGPIAGGVIGGVLVVMIATFLVWRFCIKKRREAFDQNENEWTDVKAEAEKQDDEFVMQRDARASTHTVGSIASTVLTRASNIIQIAYIPGVTNRSVESSPDLLIPPVPPIPAASPSLSTVSTPQPGQHDQHYFMPGDLRDSTYSGTYSGYTADDRTSYARSSMTPSMMRSSVATAAYRDNAVINPVPAQKIIRGKATAVSLRSNERTSPVATPRSPTPPMPTFSALTSSSMNTNSPIVARLGTPKAVTVTKVPSNNILKASSPLNPLTIKSPSPIISESSQRPSEKRQRRVSIQDQSHHDANSSTFDDASGSDEDHPSPQEQSLMGHNRKPSGSKSGVSPPSWQSPFKSPASAPDLRHVSSAISSTSSSPDSQAREKKQKHKRSGSLNQIIEEATRRASREPRHGGLGSVGSITSFRRDGQGPFSDDHAARTP
ncbi:MAG: hypothetical protein Q9209_000565 [Squamulea sp. 1 TL-2023]